MKYFKNDDDAFEDYFKNNKDTNNFIQWKGTDVCMDFWC